MSRKRMFFFFKQKTAYEMRISDWSSDVCSSDLSFWLVFFLAHQPHEQLFQPVGLVAHRQHFDAGRGEPREDVVQALVLGELDQIGRASCRERVCQYV